MIVPEKIYKLQLTSTEINIYQYLCSSRIISDDYDTQHRRLSSKIDRKLRRAIDRKKQELGMKSEFNQSP